MKNLKKSTISEMTPEDAFKIASWDEKFGSEKEFESIKKYLNFETQMLAEDLQFSGKPSNITQPLTLADILDGYHFAEIENPDYDPSKKYIHRSDRPEWDAVGMLGVLTVRDDGTCFVNGFCQVTDGGIATKSNTGYRVVERVNDHLIKIIFK